MLNMISSILLLPTLIGVTLCYILLRRMRRSSPAPKERRIVVPQEPKKAAPNLPIEKPEQWYRDLFLRLHNLENNADVLVTAREELLSMFAQATALGLSKPHEEILKIKRYDSNAVWKLLNNENKKTMDDWQIYLDKRKRGVGPDLFSTKAAAKDWLVQHAPVKLVDGAWLAHINKIATPFPLRTITKDAWQIFSEELGDGDLSKHHVYLYRQLLQEVGCCLPDSHHEDFIKDCHWNGLDTKPSWQAAVGQLLISLFPHDFLPEILGFNMHYEQVTLSTMKAAFELKALGIDPYYFLLHVSIDNADSGHTAMAGQIVTRYLDKVRADRGEEAVAQEWKRVQVGYMMSRTLEDPAHYKRQDSSRVLAKVQLPLDPLSVRVSEILKAKASVSQRIHCPSRVKLGGQTLTKWLDECASMPKDNNKVIGLLTALTLAKPWVYPGASKKSLLMRELGWEGRMYGAFTHEETTTFAAWIDSLGPDNSAWGYWRFTGRKPFKSSDDIARLQHGIQQCPPTPSLHNLKTSADLAQSEYLRLEHHPKIAVATGPRAMELQNRPLELVSLWFAHIGLLENTLDAPSRTTTQLHASLLRLRRAEAGFGMETEIVAGTDEMKRTSHPGLVEIGLDLVSRSNLAHGINISCTRDVLAMARKHGMNDEASSLADNMLSWRFRPVGNLGLLIGLSLAFLELKREMISLPDLLSSDMQVVLEVILTREREHLGDCVQELRRNDSSQYMLLEAGYKFGLTTLEQCFAGTAHA